MSLITKELFRDDSYLKTCEAKVTHIDERGIQFDQSICYPHGGGQLGDHGYAILASAHPETTYFGGSLIPSLLSIR